MWQAHVAGFHPVIFEDEASDEGEGVKKQTSEITGEAGTPASWHENGGENAAYDANVGDCLDRNPEGRVEALVDEGDRLEITDSSACLLMTYHQALVAEQALTFPAALMKESPPLALYQARRL